MAEFVVVAVKIHGQEATFEAVSAVIEDHHVVGVGFEELPAHSVEDILAGSVFIEQEHHLIVGQGAAFRAFQEGVHQVGVVVGEFEGRHGGVAAHADYHGPDFHVAAVLYSHGCRWHLFGRVEFLDGRAVHPHGAVDAAVGVMHDAFAVGSVVGPCAFVAVAVGIIADAFAVRDAVAEFTDPARAVGVVVIAFADIAQGRAAVAQSADVVAAGSGGLGRRRIGRLGIGSGGLCRVGGWFVVGRR